MMARKTAAEKRLDRIMEHWRAGGYGPISRTCTDPTTSETNTDESFSADSFIAGMALGYLMIRGGNVDETAVEAILKIFAHRYKESDPDLGQYHAAMSWAAQNYRKAE